jgi:anti-sigma factor RsiW
VNCAETRHWLHGYADGELDLARSLEIEQHLRDCADCARAHAGVQALRGALSAPALYYRPASSLRDRVRDSLRQTAAARPARRKRSWRPLALAAAVAAGVLLTVGLLRQATTRATIRDIVSSHARAVLAETRVDMASTDQHTVKPWLNDKLGYSPNVPDLKAQGFNLIGGRLDFIDQRTVGVIVYGRRKHIIDVYFWPSDQGIESAPRKTTQQGYHLIHWTNAGMTYWVVSDLNEAELGQFAELIAS